MDKKTGQKDGLQEESKIPSDLQFIIKDPEIPITKKKQIIKAMAGIAIGGATSFSGPIPPPEVLKGYNEILEDGAERIFLMTENQSKHRMELESHAIREELRQSGRGQVFGFILGIIGLALTTALALLGHETIAGIFGTTTILGLVTVFVIGKKSQKKDLKKKE